MAARTVSSATASSSYAPNAGPSTSTSSSRTARASSPATSLLTPTTALTTAASARSRHSLYGAEDRVVLDIGSRVWKIGFSGESTPRAVFDVGELWTYDAIDAIGTKEQQRQCHRMIKKLLRRVYYDELMTDSKARKVIILENPMLPLRIKQTVAKILFEHLHIPSLSFALSPLCALLSIGRATGLVVDVGNLETCLLPIYASRPLFSYLRTSPVASRKLSFHLRELLKRFAIYVPNSSSTASTSRQPSSSISPPQSRAFISPVPDEVLTMAVVEEIKTRACFVDPDMPDDGPSTLSSSRDKQSVVINSDDYVSSTSSEADREAYSSYRHFRLKRKYLNEEDRTASEATTLTLRLASGTLSIPGWLRHACTDIFFDSTGDVDEPSIPELILDSLLKLAIDLRKVFISNILVTGGGSMLPGFPLRLAESLRTLLHRDKRYVSLRGLSRSICIVNCASRTGPATRTPEGGATQAEGEGSEGNTAATFAWERSLLAWVGASLVGAMKASGKEEWTREAWEAAGNNAVDSGDWTRRGW